MEIIVWTHKYDILPNSQKKTTTSSQLGNEMYEMKA